MSVLDRFSLAGKVAYVTGSAQGIGYAFAQGLAQAGADVALADINIDAATTAAARLQEETGRRGRGHHIDVTDPARAGGPVLEVAEDHRGVDAALHDADFAAHSLA